MHSGTIAATATERVHFGRPSAEAVAEEATGLGAERVFVLASGTLNRDTDLVAAVRGALGERFAGLYDRMPAHTPRGAVVEAAKAAAGADLVVTIGGGSVTDAGKMVRICLTHGVTEAAELDAFRIRVDADGRHQAPALEAPRVGQVAVPTTLSGGEFNALAGCTDTAAKVKQGYRHQALAPCAVVLDPAATLATPEWLWLSTGIRSVDHAVEGLCSAQANLYCDGLAQSALALLGEGLRRCKREPEDLEARLGCQVGVWQAMAGVLAGVPMGASHAIGHVLGGTCDVPHGHTSCVMLPSVLRYNAAQDAGRQALVSAALGRPGEAAADVVAALVAELGLPGCLADVGVGPERFETVAANSMHDPWIHTNPRPIGGADDVVDILRMAA